MELEPEQKIFPVLATGYQVAIEYLAGPTFEEEHFERLKEGTVLHAQPQARTRLAYLRGTSNYGVEIADEPDSDHVRFIPWGAVLAIYGWSRQELIQNEREARRQAQAGEAGEDSPPQDR